MLYDEDAFWILTSIAGLCVVLVYQQELFGPLRESFAQDSHDSPDTIGMTSHIKVKTIRPIVPFPAVALRDHVHLRIVNVPLVPFRSPFRQLPPITGPVPTFLLYKPSVLTPVRNQGDCGSCWAFSVCDMLSDRTMLATSGRYQSSLSVQQLLSCFDRTGCDGGSPEEACLWLQQSGTILYPDSQFKYAQRKGTDVTTPCPRRPPSKTTGVAVEAGSTCSIVEYIEEHTYDPVVLARNIENMKRALVLGGPFYCAMAVYDDLFQYSGLYPYVPDKAASLVGGHAINIIGYCDKGVDTRKGYRDVGYWVCRNSWGAEWPTQTDMPGYFTVVMGSNVCGIESRCGFATPTLYGSPGKGSVQPLDELRYTSFQDYFGK